MIDRSEASRLLALTIAHDNAGNPGKANVAARELVTLLADAGVLPAAMGAPLAGVMVRPARRVSTSELVEWRAAL